MFKDLKENKKYYTVSISPIEIKETQLKNISKNSYTKIVKTKYLGIQETSCSKYQGKYYNNELIEIFTTKIKAKKYLKYQIAEILNSI